MQRDPADLLKLAKALGVAQLKYGELEATFFPPTPDLPMLPGEGLPDVIPAELRVPKPPSEADRQERALDTALFPPDLPKE
jgi:hypothetical protein